MRSNKGQSCYTLAIVLVPLSLALGAFSADSMHCVSARNELQAACDAGALAGAYKLQQSTAAATTAASTVALNNYVEKEAVSSSSPNTTVQVTVVPPTSTTSGTVTVAATRKIKLMFSCLFGHAFDKVSASATAGGASRLSQVPQGKLFPIALSVDAIGAYTSLPLFQLGVGQPIIIDLGATNKDSIACSTGFTAGNANASYFRDAMDESLGVNPVSTPAVVPSVEIGDQISLNNGNGGFGSMLSDPEYSKLLNQTIIVPLIEGGAPYNQSRPVIGFIGLKITSMVKVTGAPLLTATIVRPAVRGQSSGQAYTGAYAAAMANLTPSVVHLVR